LSTHDVPGRWTVGQFKPVRGTDAADPEPFEHLMQLERFPKASAYDARWVQWNHMGPHVLWLTEALTEVVSLKSGMRVLDLGCGTALSSIFLAREFGVRVWAADLWISPTDNWPRIVEAGVADMVTPVRVEAHDLPFAHDFFDTAVSVDSYHYFGTDERYLPYYARCVQPGGTIAMVVPGNSVDVEELPAGLGLGWASADFFTFRSPDWWSRLWTRSGVVDVEHADMISEGWELWRRFVEAGVAWDGTGTVETSGDGALISSPSGRSLGFTRIRARRRSEPVA
jgi:SAM-dependent methyltransferase